jgi:hypothetical protein
VAADPLSLASPLLDRSGTDSEFIDHTDVDDDRGHGRAERRTLRVAALRRHVVPRRPASLPAPP